jgi:hypothetical protein
MKNEFSYDVLKNKYGKRVGNYKGRGVIVRSKYDDLGDNVYILYDYNNALIVDGYWIATVDEDGNMNRKWESPWKKLERPVSDISSSGPVMENDVKPEINLDVDMTLVDSLLESAYNDILSDLMYKE